jgi:hypothetical protein
MAHYAFLNESNIVTQVITGKDEGLMDWEHYYSLKVGQACKRTSYNTFAGQHTDGKTPFRKNYAGVGFTYDPILDAFIPPKQFASWTLNDDTCLWEAPVAYPDDGEKYQWNEGTQSWAVVVINAWPEA